MSLIFRKIYDNRNVLSTEWWTHICIYMLYTFLYHKRSCSWQCRLFFTCDLVEFKYTCKEKVRYSPTQSKTYQLIDVIEYLNLVDTWRATKTQSYRINSNSNRNTQRATAIHRNWTEKLVLVCTVHCTYIRCAIKNSRWSHL